MNDPESMEWTELQLADPTFIIFTPAKGTFLCPKLPLFNFIFFPDLSPSFWNSYLSFLFHSIVAHHAEVKFMIGLSVAFSASCLFIIWITQNVP